MIIERELFIFTLSTQTKSPLQSERAFPKPRIFELLDVHCPSSVADFYDIHALGTGIDFLQHADTLGGCIGRASVALDKPGSVLEDE